jgi:nucleoside phosphorylase
MYDVAIFAALGWEARAVAHGLAAAERGPQPWTWRGYLGDGASCLVVQTGIGPARARDAADGVRARLFAACGCAGGLEPGLRAGDVVVASSVVVLDAHGGQTERLPAAAAGLGAWAAARAVPIRVGALASTPVVLSTGRAKAAAAATGALAVEMESAGIVAVARAQAAPFVGLRVVLDTAGDPLPLGGSAVDETTGELRPVRALAAAAVRPQQWRAIARLARQQAVVERRLRALSVMLLGAGLDAFGLAPVDAAVAR